MWFWAFMLIYNALIPIAMIIFGYMMYKRTPKKINYIYGYRTSRSMKNDETWRFAHDYCGRLWTKVGLFLLLPSVIAMIPFADSSEDIIGAVTLIVLGLQIMAMIGSILAVESALKKNFDENGKPNDL